jgi:hypothetical protein
MITTYRGKNMKGQIRNKIFKEAGIQNFLIQLEEK